MDSELTYRFDPAFSIDSVSDTGFSLHSGITQGSVLDFESSNADLDCIFDNNFDFCAATDLSLDVVYPPGDAWDPGEYDRGIVGYHLSFPPMDVLPATSGEIAKTEVALLGATKDQAHPPQTEGTPDYPVKRTRTRRKRKKKVTQEEEGAKRAKFLGRNRLAVSTCRRQKQNWIAELETRAQNSVGVMAKKLSEAAELTAEVNELRGLVMAHKPCKHANLESWIDAELQRITASTESSVSTSRVKPLGSCSTDYEDCNSGSSINLPSRCQDMESDGTSQPPASESSVPSC